MDKISELLLKLSENASLAPFLLGMFLILLGGAEDLPIGNETITLSPLVKIILIIFGVSISFVSTLSLISFLFKDRNFKIPREKARESSSETQQQMVKDQEVEMANLKETIEEIKVFIESRNDETSLAVLEILNGVKDQAREFAKAFHESRLAAQWLSAKQKTLLQSIELPKINTKTEQDLYTEIQKYTDLLIESLEKSKYITPRARNITFHLSNPFPYIQIIQDLQTKIKQEYNHHQDGLREPELKKLNNYFDQLVEDIRCESSL